MSDKNSRRNQTTDALFDAILSLETREECYNFFEDLCTVKAVSYTHLTLPTNSRV